MENRESGVPDEIKEYVTEQPDKGFKESGVQDEIRSEEKTKGPQGASEPRDGKEEVAKSREQKDYIINLETQPFTPKGWEIREQSQLPNRVRGQLEWSQDSVELSSVPGRSSLYGESVLPANVLDWLLEHPDQIPEEYVGKHIPFWGTVYYNPEDKRTYIRDLYSLTTWDGKTHYESGWVDTAFGEHFLDNVIVKK